MRPWLAARPHSRGAVPVERLPACRAMLLSRASECMYEGPEPAPQYESILPEPLPRKRGHRAAGSIQLPRVPTPTPTPPARSHPCPSVRLPVPHPFLRTTSLQKPSAASRCTA
eukprot:7026171-Prymnesium_polylepis.1